MGGVKVILCHLPVNAGQVLKTGFIHKGCIIPPSAMDEICPGNGAELRFT